ncbi:MAG: hypothetical protein BJ554DRAFT_3694, partial [Olpidium bornovanus]
MDQGALGPGAHDGNGVCCALAQAGSVRLIAGSSSLLVIRLCHNLYGSSGLHPAFPSPCPTHFFRASLPASKQPSVLGVYFPER